jgi:hypothetical protein
VGANDDPFVEVDRLNIPPATDQLAGQKQSLDVVYLLVGANKDPLVKADRVDIPPATDQLVE